MERGTPLLAVRVKVPCRCREHRVSICSGAPMRRNFGSGAATSFHKQTEPRAFTAHEQTQLRRGTKSRCQVFVSCRSGCCDLRLRARCACQFESPTSLGLPCTRLLVVEGHPPKVFFGRAAEKDGPLCWNCFVPDPSYTLMFSCSLSLSRVVAYVSESI